MLITDKFALVPLHPDAAASIPATVAKVLGARALSPVPKEAAELVALGKPVVALVCDPRAWYLALWRQGCAQKGGLYRRLTDDAQWAQVKGRMERRDKEGALPANWSAERARSFWYADPQSVPAFKEWLVAVLNTMALRPVVSRNYQKDPLSRGCGLMSYEYQKLFIHNPNALGAPPTNAAGLNTMNQARGIVAHAVRAEAMAEDMTKALEALGEVLGAPQRGELSRAMPTLDEQRADWASFFDEELRQLVFKRERFIALRFQYGRRPAAKTAAGAGAGEGPSAEAAAARAAKRALRRMDPDDPAKQAALAELRRQQDERATKRRAARKAAQGAPVAAKTTRPRLADFDDDEEESS